MFTPAHDTHVILLDRNPPTSRKRCKANQGYRYYSGTIPLHHTMPPLRMNLLLFQTAALWIALLCRGSSGFSLERFWQRPTVQPPSSSGEWQSVEQKETNEVNRREWLRVGIGSALVTTSTSMQPRVVQARLVLDEETGEKRMRNAACPQDMSVQWHNSMPHFCFVSITGDYVEVEDVDWQTAWKERLDKASSMSQEEIFSAARGASNRPTDGEESAASRKRRALSTCRSTTARKAANVPDEKECTARVLGGETDFILNGTPVSSIDTPSTKTQGMLVSRSTALRLGVLAVSLLAVGPSCVQAAEDKTVYLSGKPPKVPGAKPKDKNDLSGTRKDPNFLRSIADCKSQCESKGKPKEDCLSECQDICCTTYEQVRV